MLDDPVAISYTTTPKAQVSEKEPMDTPLLVDVEVYDEKKPVDAPLLVDVEVNVTKTPIPRTSNIRATVRHLTTTYGKRVRFNGLLAFMFWGLISSTWRHFVLMILRDDFNFDPTLARYISTCLAGVMYCRLHMLWTHMMIAVPGTTWNSTYSQENRQFIKKLAIPAFMNAYMWELSIQLPLILYKALPAFQFFRSSAFESAEPGFHPLDRQEVCRLLVAGLFGVIGFVGIYIPAHVGLIRVEASLLPSTVETIVPFDRTFGGRVKAEADGGSATLGHFEAWATFGSAQRFRLFKLFGKIFAIETLLHLAFGALIAVEVFAFVGTENLVKLANMRPVH